MKRKHDEFCFQKLGRIRAVAPTVRSIARHVWILGAALSLSSICADAAHWKEISPEEMAVTAPRVDPSAGAEILLREVRIDDSKAEGIEYFNYVRIKVFDRRGVEALDKIEIVDTRGHHARNIAARVVKPDGEVIPVDRKSIYTREALRMGSVRIRVKSFSFPALEPGCIVEYQWYEESEGSVAGIQLQFQRQFPAWAVRYRYRPFNYERAGYKLYTALMHCRLPKPEADSSGFYLFELKDVPMAVEEPWMPPEQNTQSTLTFYFREERQDIDEYWNWLGKRVDQVWGRDARDSKLIKKTVAEITGESRGAAAKLRQIYDFCRTSIRNTDLDSSGYTDEELDSLKENKNANATLEHGYGSAFDINQLFLAMVSSAGFDARFARIGDRSERFFAKSITASFTLPDVAVAVKVEGEWRFFNPGSTYQPYGSLPWQDETSVALICDRRKSELVATPALSGDESKIVRNARLSLDEDGNLEGDVTMVAYGHLGVEKKRVLDAKTPEERADEIEKSVRDRIGAAELTKVEVQHAAEPDVPIEISYHVRVPGYAARTGSRLFLQPAFFEQGLEQMFSAENRALDVYFRFPRCSEDNVEIKVPEGYTLEEGTAPHSLDGGKSFDYSVKLVWSEGQHVFKYSRHMKIDALLIPVANYAPLREYFRMIHDEDNHTVVLRRSDTVASISP